MDANVWRVQNDGFDVRKGAGGPPFLSLVLLLCEVHCWCHTGRYGFPLQTTEIDTWIPLSGIFVCFVTKSFQKRLLPTSRLPIPLTYT